MSFPSAATVPFLNSSTSVCEPQTMKTAHTHRDTQVLHHKAAAALNTLCTVDLEGIHFHSNCCFTFETEVNGKAECHFFMAQRECEKLD